MQTTGATLLAVEQCSLACVPMPAQDDRSADGLLYFAVVLCDGHHLRSRQRLEQRWAAKMRPGCCGSDPGSIAGRLSKARSTAGLTPPDDDDG